MAALLPGPVTLVVANPAGLYPLACREDRARLGIRLIDGPLAGAAAAIFQTSANRSGEPAPARFEDVDPADRRRGRHRDRRRRAHRAAVDRRRRNRDRATGESRRSSARARSARRKPCGFSSRLEIGEELEPRRACRPSPWPGQRRADSVSIPLDRPRVWISNSRISRSSSTGWVSRISRRTYSIDSRKDSHQRRTPSGPR